MNVPRETENRVVAKRINKNQKRCEIKNGSKWQ
jgi:hypothetical protein